MCLDVVLVQHVDMHCIEPGHLARHAFQCLKKCILVCMNGGNTMFVFINKKRHYESMNNSQFRKSKTNHLKITHQCIFVPLLKVSHGLHHDELLQCSCFPFKQESAHDESIKKY